MPVGHALNAAQNDNGDLLYKYLYETAITVVQGGGAWLRLDVNFGASLLLYWPSHGIESAETVFVMPLLSAT